MNARIRRRIAALERRLSKLDLELAGLLTRGADLRVASEIAIRRLPDPKAREVAEKAAADLRRVAGHCRALIARRNSLIAKMRSIAEIT